MQKGPSIPIEDIIALLPDNVYWLDKNGVYQGCNEQQAKMMGFSSRFEVIGKRNKDLPCLKNHPETWEALDRNNIEIMESGQPKRLEETAYDANNVFGTYLSHKVPLRDHNDKVIGLLGISYKIDDIKEREEKLISEKENMELTLKSIIAHLPGHVYWKDKDGKYLGCNDKQALSLGYTDDREVIGKTDFDLVWKNKAKEIRENDIKVMTAGDTIVTEESGTLANGSTIVAISQKAPLRNNKGEIAGILGISLDITELKQAQEREKIALKKMAEANAKAQAQEEIQKAILTFTGTMSHDLRTPLSTIQLIISILDKSLPTLLAVYSQAKNSDEDIPYLNDQKVALLEDLCKNIMNATKQADSYIDATLKIIKGAATGSELLKPEDLVLCSIEEIIRRVLRDYPFKEGESDKLHSDTLQSFMFSGNSIFMARILQNLIKNAFEQIRLKGKGEIFIGCEEGSSFNLLKIKDTAGGVSPPVIEKLFEGLHSSKKGGTGLGLSSAKLIMQAFGGDISCELVEDDCIEFVLKFPPIF